MDKKELRREGLARRKALSQEECRERSKVIARKLIELEEFKNSNRILLYAPIRNEVETKEIYQESKRLNKDIYYPRVQSKEMEFYFIDNATEFETSAYGICEPIPESTVVFEPKEDDVIFMVLPGAAFDRVGNRIGYGGGYYDKYLHRLEKIVSAEQIYKVAIAYENQLVETGLIEKEIHDVRMDYVITEIEEYRV